MSIFPISISFSLSTLCAPQSLPAERNLTEPALHPVQIANPKKLAQAAVRFGDNSSEDEMFNAKSVICKDKCAFPTPRTLTQI